jgi:hypothetical protein
VSPSLASTCFTAHTLALSSDFIWSELSEIADLQAEAITAAARRALSTRGAMEEHLEPESWPAGDPEEEIFDPFLTTIFNK